MTKTKLSFLVCNLVLILMVSLRTNTADACVLVVPFKSEVVTPTLIELGYHIVQAEYDGQRVINLQEGDYFLTVVNTKYDSSSNGIGFGPIGIAVGTTSYEFTASLARIDAHGRQITLSSSRGNSSTAGLGGHLGFSGSYSRGDYDGARNRALIDAADGLLSCDEIRRIETNNARPGGPVGSPQRPVVQRQDPNVPPKPDREFLREER